MDGTGKSCAAATLLTIVIMQASLGLCVSANTCMRAACKVYNTSSQRLVANPIAKRTVMSILFCLFFFFSDVYKSLQKISE